MVARLASTADIASADRLNRSALLGGGCPVRHKRAFCTHKRAPAERICPLAHKLSFLAHKLSCLAHKLSRTRAKNHLNGPGIPGAISWYAPQQ